MIRRPPESTRADILVPDTTRLRSYGRNLRRGLRDPEWNPGATNLALGGPIRNAVHSDDDPPEGIGRACAPCGQSIAGDVDAAEQLRPLQTVKIERQGFAVVDDAERDVGLAVGQICQ